MSEATFKQLLADLVQAALESGIDPFAVHRELATAGMVVMDCRCDLVMCDDGEDDPLR
jgi:hypothetical protein